MALATQTLAQRRTEADAVTTAFIIALNQLGAGSIQQALATWHADVAVTAGAGGQVRWMRKAARQVMTSRKQAALLAIAYYRLVRALRTGETVGPEAGTTTLGELRDDFNRLTLGIPRSVRERAGLTAAVVGGGTPSAGPGLSDRDRARWTDRQADPETRGDGDRIPVVRLPRWESSDARLERAAEAEIREALANLGTGTIIRKLRDIDPEAPASQVDKERKEIHRLAGIRQAASSERVAMSGARSKVWDLASQDKRVLGYIRVSLTGTPCHFCAMLISRGPVYSSAEKARFDEGDLYHDNCKCSVEPVFSAEQYQSDLYALNREYSDLWPKVTKGLRGDAARQAWRRYFYTTQKAAQAAAQNAQEA